MIDVSAYWSDVPFGVLAARGADARRFLQGQLSQDVAGLEPHALRWAGLHNPQGRALALLRLVADGPDVLALLPPALIEPLLPALRRYVLRAKVTLADETALWQLRGVQADAAVLAAALPGARCVEWLPDRTRCVVLARRGSSEAGAVEAALAPPGVPARSAADWHRLDVAAGLPQVYAATQGEFVAQMLNLDLIGGIAFDKGCYTGQEIIARTHYRGRMKRRMQRFASRADRAQQWPPGAKGRLPDGRSFEIVDSADAAAGGCELLAVASYGSLAEESAARLDESLPLCADASPLPLPYALPALDAA